jgi:polysaccharide pyruvyl transferase WcaK-like protein
MMSPDEREDVRQLVYQEMAALEYRIAREAGSYRYMCLVGGSPVFAHSPVGPILRVLQ